MTNNLNVMQRANYQKSIIWKGYDYNNIMYVVIGTRSILKKNVYKKNENTNIIVGSFIM